MRPTARPLILLTLATALSAAGCVHRPAPRVVMLSDGVLKSPSAEEAEAYCRNFGAPLRWVGPTAAPAPGGEVTYRCD